MDESARNPIRKVWQTLSSIKTGVILLITVVIVAAAGTIILQRPMTEPEEIQRAYSPYVLRILDAAGLTDVYHAWWFVLLLGLVSLSIVAASIERFPNSWRYFSRPYKSPTESFRKALGTRKQIPIEDEETAVLAAGRALRDMGFKPELVTIDKRVSLFAERNRISELAVYIVHASLLLIFLGGIVDALYGWRGSLVLTPGRQSSEVSLRNGVTQTLPFAIKCDSAGQENYTDGSPKRWWSKLAVVQNGSEVQRKEIVVNDPLVFQGIRFYQSSYGPTGKLDRLVLSATQAGSQGAAREVSLALNESVSLDADTSVRLVEFIPDYVVRDNQIYTRSESVENPAAHLVVISKKTGQAVNVWLPAIPGFAENDKSSYNFEAQDLKMGYFTGLEVSHEPGQWAVWSGVILMGLGLAIVFYLVHVRFWVVPVLDARGRLVLWVGGAANKNRETFEEKFAKLVETIEKELKSEQAVCASMHAASVAGD